MILPFSSGRLTILREYCVDVWLQFKDDKKYELGHNEIEIHKFNRSVSVKGLIIKHIYHRAYQVR